MQRVSVNGRFSLRYAHVWQSAGIQFWSLRFLSRRKVVAMAQFPLENNTVYTTKFENTHQSRFFHLLSSHFCRRTVAGLHQKHTRRSGHSVFHHTYHPLMKRKERRRLGMILRLFSLVNKFFTARRYFLYKRFHENKINREVCKNISLLQFKG